MEKQANVNSSMQSMHKAIGTYCKTSTSEKLPHSLSVFVMGFGQTFLATGLKLLLESWTLLSGLPKSNGTGLVVLTVSVTERVCWETDGIGGSVTPVVIASCKTSTPLITMPRSPTQRGSLELATISAWRNVAVSLRTNAPAVVAWTHRTLPVVRTFTAFEAVDSGAGVVDTLLLVGYRVGMWRWVYQAGWKNESYTRA